MGRRGQRLGHSVIPEPLDQRRPVLKGKPKPPPIVVAPASKPPPPPDAPKTRFLAPWEQGFVPGAVPPAVPIIPDGQDPSEDYPIKNWDLIPERRRMLFRLFVAEFIKDYHAGNAVRRMGLNYANPMVTGNNWLREPYVAHLLDEHVRNAEEECLVTRNSVIAGLVREANNTGPDASAATRIQAMSRLMKVLGMDVTKIEKDITVSGGVMIVPVTGSTNSPENWEKLAAPMQQALKAGIPSQMTLDVDVDKMGENDEEGD